MEHITELAKDSESDQKRLENEATDYSEEEIWQTLTGYAE